MTDIHELLTAYLADWPTGLQRIQAVAALRVDLPTLMDELTDDAVRAARDQGCGWDEIGSALATPLGVVAVGKSPMGGRANGVRNHDGKYQRLWAWLVEQTEDEFDLTFNDVESILGFELPRSSREHLPHWHGYEGSAVARAIIDAGFKARNVDLARERVTFTRAAR